MKIILVNYRYFISGGPERYLFNVKELFEKHGHDVIPFSIKHNNNEPCVYDKYFASPIGGGDVTYFSDSKITKISELFKFFGRMFYSFEVRARFKELVLDTQPDIVYVLHYQNKMSPSFLGVTRRYNIPVVQRISDFGHICANQVFYNYKLKETCERCLSGSKFNAVKYNCVYDSKIYSFIKVLALRTHEFLGVIHKIDAFVIPSEFTFSKLRLFNIPANKLVYLPTFYKSLKKGCHELPISYNDFALYVGRIEEEKGIMTMVKAFEGTRMYLKVIGFSSRNYDQRIKEYLKGKQHNIEFLGKQSFETVKKHLSNCAFTITPSECYDNFPNSVLESYAFQKAVVSSDLGSLREMIRHQDTGLLFESGNFIQLRECCLYLFANKDKCKRMGQEGRIWVRNKLSEEKHYERLITLFHTLISEKSLDSY